jgi:hypothetical protein
LQYILKSHNKIDLITCAKDSCGRGPTDFVKYLREFEAIFEKALIPESGVQMGFFDDKTSGKYLVTRSLKVILRIAYVNTEQKLAKALTRLNYILQMTQLDIQGWFLLVLFLSGPFFKIHHT